MIVCRLTAIFLFTAAWTGMALADGQVAPTIEEISPLEGKIGAEVTIIGRGFDAGNTVLFGGVAVRHVQVKSAAAIACTASPRCKSGFIQTLVLRVPKGLKRGAQQIAVKTAAGISNRLMFSVTR